ncbi:hypothetical protein AAC387_Pa01g1659 [Persea americana]
MERNIRYVWSNNFEEEFDLIMKIRHSHHYVALDTEFQRVIVDCPRNANEDTRYSHLDLNIANRQFTQIGLCFFDAYGNLPYSGSAWQFTFKGFNSRRYPSEIKEAIDPKRFETFLKKMISGCELHWVTFHGLYDFGYMTQILTNSTLPDTLNEFLEVMAVTFPRVYDIKYMATFYKELNNGELGLELLAKILKVERYGNSHQAGSDSLLTAEIFTKMKRVFQLERKLGFYEGYLYSITSRIPRCRYLVRPIRTCAYLVSLPSGLLCRQLPVSYICRASNIM